MLILGLNLKRPATAPQKNKEMKEWKQNNKNRLTSSMISSKKYNKYRVPSLMLKHIRLS